ncbi:MAG TPA: helix-turn-helix domain-containing protein [Solirubrobacterales bacterium]|nr:helix-turn-helix domain-containing protein [Solirubrobacterales bacterium]
MGERGRTRRGDGSRGGVGGRSRRGSAAGHSPGDVRTALAARLRLRMAELEAAITTRVYAIADPREVRDAAYLQGLHAALPVAIEYAISALELGERRALEIPPSLLAQARLAARGGVPLDTVLRRYVAGDALIGDLLFEESGRAEVPGSVLRQLLGTQATVLDRLLAAVGAEYAREAENRPTSAADRRRECVKRLLAGELVDHAELGYDLDAHHLALIAKGEDGLETMRELATKVDRRLLAVRHEEEATWACWLGGSRPLVAKEVARALGAIAPARALVTVGEPGDGLLGWRLSHRQAKAALPIAERRGERIVRYADVAFQASALHDDLIATSLREIYLAPLETTRDGGRVARETLRAYFAAERNVSSTAARLGVDRRTVSNRIRAIEDRLGCPLADVATDLETALRLDE